MQRWILIGLLLVSCGHAVTPCGSAGGTKCFVPVIETQPMDLSTGLADSQRQIRILFDLGTGLMDSAIASLQSTVFVTSPTGAAVSFSLDTPTPAERVNPSMSEFVVVFTAPDSGWYEVGLTSVPDGFVTLAPPVKAGERWSVRVHPDPVLTPTYVDFQPESGQVQHPTGLRVTVLFSQPFTMPGGAVALSGDNGACTLANEETERLYFHCLPSTATFKMPASLHVVIPSGLKTLSTTPAPLALVNGEASLDTTLAPVATTTLLPLQ